MLYYIHEQHQAVLQKYPATLIIRKQLKTNSHTYNDTKTDKTISHKKAV